MNKMQEEVAVVEEWREVNGLQLNVGKCEFCLFTPSTSEYRWKPDISIMGRPVKDMQNKRFLEVTYDKMQIFGTHVQETTGSKRGDLCAVGVPLPKGRANHHTFTLPPERGAQIRRFFGAQPPGAWLVARLLLSGDVEQSLGPRRRWQCALCSQYIKTKSQTSSRCNHTTPHITCTNITQYTKSQTSVMRTTHNTHRTSSIHTPHKYHQPIPNHPPPPNNYCTH